MSNGQPVCLPSEAQWSGQSKASGSQGAPRRGAGRLWLEMDTFGRLVRVHVAPHFRPLLRHPRCPAAARAAYRALAEAAKVPTRA
ncbi:hypothetical protein GCM10010279_68970 [Streptomyces mutabilis]|nr:hypothetical protein GCM10010279_68970 [Streptomyces mutabilis]